MSTPMRVIGKEGYYGIIHRDRRAIIWPVMDCSVPVFNQRNIGWANDVGKPVLVPEGWSLEYTQVLDLSKFDKWSFIININLQKSWILRSTFKLEDPFKGISQYSPEGVDKCLKMIPREVIAGTGTIILEDSIEWVLFPLRNMIEERVARLGIKHRVKYLSCFKMFDHDLYRDDIFMDTFESQTLFDLYGNKQTSDDYDDPIQMGNNFICLNRRCDTHRAMITKELIDRDLMSMTHHTYSDRFANVFLHLPNSLPLIEAYIKDRGITMEDIESLPNMRFDEVFDQKHGWPRNGFTPELKELYKDSKYYIITETLNYQWKPFRFVTEKTYRSFLYKKPFIMIGNKGLLNYLHEQGYKVSFDNIGKMYNEDNSNISDIAQFNLTADLIDSLRNVKPSQLDEQRCLFNFKHWTKRAMPRIWEQVLDLVEV